MEKAKISNICTVAQESWWSKAKSKLANLAPKFKKITEAFEQFITKHLNRLFHVRVSYTPIIAALLLVWLNNAGYLADFPALVWMAEVLLRLWNWFMSIMQILAYWTTDMLKFFQSWPILGDIAEWFQYIFFG